MRIITGKFKGRRLKTVSNKKTRPTSDKLKEAIFHKIGPFFESGHCLDLFAGSGSLGIEALSRGMDRAIFVDKSKDAIQTIHKNIQSLRIEEQCEVYRNDAFKAIQKMSKENIRFDLILLDPPYDQMDYSKLIDEIEKKEIANKNCFIYVEHRPNETIHFNDEKFILVNNKTYSSTTSTSILQKI